MYLVVSRRGTTTYPELGHGPRKMTAMCADDKMDEVQCCERERESARESARAREKARKRETERERARERERERELSLIHISEPTRRRGIS